MLGDIVERPERADTLSAPPRWYTATAADPASTVTRREELHLPGGPTYALCHPLAMRIVHPGLGPGHAIRQFGSAGASHLGGVRFDGPGGLTFIKLGPGGHLGCHPTVLAQLYCVVEGSGWVSGGDGEHVSLEPGQAAHWAPARNKSPAPIRA
jgi:hypothetical protein